MQSAQKRLNSATATKTDGSSTRRRHSGFARALGYVISGTRCQWKPFQRGVMQHNGFTGPVRPTSLTAGSGAVAACAVQTRTLAGESACESSFASLVISFELDNWESTGAKITLTLAALI